VSPVSLLHDSISNVLKEGPGTISLASRLEHRTHQFSKLLAVQNISIAPVHSSQRRKGHTLLSTDIPGGIYAHVLPPVQQNFLLYLLPIPPDWTMKLYICYQPVGMLAVYSPIVLLFLASVLQEK